MNIADFREGFHKMQKQDESISDGKSGFKLVVIFDSNPAEIIIFLWKENTLLTGTPQWKL